MNRILELIKTLDKMAGCEPIKTHAALVALIKNISDVNIENGKEVFYVLQEILHSIAKLTNEEQEIIISIPEFSELVNMVDLQIRKFSLAKLLITIGRPNTPAVLRDPEHLNVGDLNYQFNAETYYKSEKYKDTGG